MMPAPTARQQSHQLGHLPEAQAELTEVLRRGCWKDPEPKTGRRKRPREGKDPTARPVFKLEFASLYFSQINKFHKRLH